MDLIDDIFINGNQKSIDVVFTYVNPCDKIWREKYNFYNKTSNISSIRFDNNITQIKFSLLTIQKYAGVFVDNVYIVSDNQKFDLTFLNDELFISKIKWINHTDIIDEIYLPTFNSMVIEAFLWKIPGIKSSFVYFNDDMFLGNYVFPIDFFTNDDYIKQFYNNNNHRSFSKHPWYININESNDLFNNKFRTQQYLSPIHAPYHISTTDMKMCFNIFFQDLEFMLKNHKIRSYYRSHNLIFLSAMYSYFTNKAQNSKTSFSFINNCNNFSLKKISKSKKKTFYCFHAYVSQKDRKRVYNELNKIFAIEMSDNIIQ